MVWYVLRLFSGQPENMLKKLLDVSGVNTVTTLVESKKAQLVVIAHDVDPIEVWHLTDRFTFLLCVVLELNI